MHELLGSTAIAFVGRHDSGKTAVVCAVIAELTRRGLDVGSIKHHGHVGFDIDVPGKDSYRHRKAGATEVMIASPDAIAHIKRVERECECDQLVRSMPGHDLVVVEGYRQSGLPCIEVMREASERDREAAARYAEEGLPASVVALVTDIPAMEELGRAVGLPVFQLPDVADEVAFGSFAGDLCDYLERNHTRPKVTLALQAGGESRRMGQSKALVDFCGRPLIAHMVERLMPAADEIVVTTNEASRLSFLGQMFPQVEMRLVPDVYEVRGALVGFVTAFEAARYDTVAIVACDMALASADLLARQVALLHDSGVDAVVPANRHGFEPMHAVYRRSTCAPLARELVESGHLRVRDMLERVKLRQLTPAEVRAIAPLGGSFANANTPEELAKLEELARS